MFWSQVPSDSRRLRSEMGYSWTNYGTETGAFFSVKDRARSTAKSSPDWCTFDPDPGLLKDIIRDCS
jgi:hypothetical protein